MMRELERCERLAPEVIAAQQLRQAAALADFAHRFSPQFRSRLKDAGLAPPDLAKPDGLAALPVLGRRDIQAAGNLLYCRKVPPGHGPAFEKQTSGSTGEPVVVKRTRITQLMYYACTVRGNFWHQRDTRLRRAVIRANVSEYSRGRNWGIPMQYFGDTGTLEAMPITTDAARLAEWLARFEPGVLSIYPSTLDALTRHCQQHGVTLPGLVHIVTGSETLSPEIRARAEEVFAAKVEDVYSSEEIGYIAIQCPDGAGYHTMDESVIVEILDAAGQACTEGEVGRIVLTDLHNFATPLIRYDIGDYAVAGGTCPCGRGLTVINRIHGRERNLIAMPDGSRFWPMVGFARFRIVAPVVQYQFIQRDVEHIDVRLVTERPLTANEETALGIVIRDALGYPFELTFQYFDKDIPRSSSGKFEEFISEVPST